MAWRWRESVEKRGTYAGLMFALSAAILVLAYAPGLFWRACAWSTIAIVGLVLLMISGNLLYAMLYLERGYSRLPLAQSDTSSDLASRQLGPPAWPRNQQAPALPGRSVIGGKRVSTIPNGVPGSARFTVGPAKQPFRFEDVMADLGAAEYLLCKVQASTALPEITGAAREECDQAIARIRRLVDEIAFQNGERKLVS